MPRVYKYHDLSGQMVGNWLVLEKASGRDKFGNMLWLCECQCDEKPRRIRSRACLIQGKKNQSCGCKARNKLRPYEALYNKLLYSNKWDRRARSVEFSYEDFLTFTRIHECHYCCALIEWTEFNLINGSAYNLDRKDNALPYTMNNCVVCCERCNKAKREWFTYEEWHGMTEYLRRRKPSPDFDPDWQNP